MPRTLFRLINLFDATRQIDAAVRAAAEFERVRGVNVRAGGPVDHRATAIPF